MQAIKEYFSKKCSTLNTGTKWNSGDLCIAQVPFKVNPDIYKDVSAVIKAIFVVGNTEFAGIELNGEFGDYETMSDSIFQGEKRFSKDDKIPNVVFLPTDKISPQATAADDHHSFSRNPMKRVAWKPNDLCNVKVARLSNPNQYVEVSGTVKAIFYCEGVKTIGVELFDEIIDCLSYDHSRFKGIDRFKKNDKLKNVVFLPFDEVLPMTSTPDINSSTSLNDSFSKVSKSYNLKDGDICNAKILKSSKPGEHIEASGTVRTVFDVGFAQIVGIELFEELDDCDAIEYPVFIGEKRFFKNDGRKNVVFVRIEDVSPITTATEIKDKSSSSISAPLKFKSSFVKIGDICRAGIRSSKTPSVLVEVQGIVKCKFSHGLQNMIGIELFEEYVDCSSTFTTGFYKGVMRFEKDGHSKNALFTTEDFVACECSVETPTSVSEYPHLSPLAQFIDLQSQRLKVGDNCFVKIESREGFDIAKGVLRCTFQDAKRQMFGIELFDENHSPVVRTNSKFKGKRRFLMRNEGTKRAIFVKEAVVSKFNNFEEIPKPSPVPAHSLQPSTSEQYVAKVGDICKAKLSNLVNPKKYLKAYAIVRAAFLHDGINMAGIESFDELPDYGASSSSLLEREEKFVKSDSLQNVFFLPCSNLVYVKSLTSLQKDLLSSESNLKSPVSVGGPDDVSTFEEFQGSFTCRVEQGTLQLVSIQLQEDIAYDSLSWGGSKTLKKTYCNCKPTFSNDYSLLLRNAKNTASVARNHCPLKATENTDFHHYGDCHFGKFGIQGFRNSGYLDSLLFAMFSTSDELDALLLSDELDDVNCKQLKTTLRDYIVEPLRKTRFVSADSASEFRKSIKERFRGISADQLLNYMFNSFLRKPLITVYDLGKTSHEFINSYQLTSYKSDETLPCLSTLLTQSFVRNNLRFLSLDDTKQLIVTIPRTASYEKFLGVIADPFLDLSRISDSIAKMCSVCGEASLYECKQCYLDKVEDVCEDVNVTYCDECSEMLHDSRKNHTLRKIPKETSSGRLMMELYSVICLENDHYVCFNKAKKLNSYDQWICFDSMFRIVDDDIDYFQPRVSQCDGISHLLDEISASCSDKQRIDIFNETKRSLSPKTEKNSNFKYHILKSAFICFYRQCNSSS